MSIPAVLCSQLEGSLPNVVIDENVDCVAVATDCVERLVDLQQDSLTQDALWRDSLSLTGHQRTFNGSATICTVWNQLRKKCNPHSFRLLPDTAQVFNLGSKPAWLTTAFVFKVEGEQAAQCSGMLNMVPNVQGNYKIWLISTMMETLDDPDGNGNPDSDPDPSFTPAARLDDGGEIDCIVVGGGMAGLCAAGRLHSMRIPYLVVETHEDVGDNWTKRYDSIHLHLSKHYSEMPFKRVYADQPYNLWSRHLADGMQKYVDTHNIQIWTSSSVTQARWDDSTRKWNVKVTKQGRHISLKAKHIIMAIGGGLDKPQYPKYSNRDSFKGTVLHTVQWKNANAMAGKKAVIIGSANSAIDIANDMVNAGLTDITIIQRSTTHVMSSTVLWPILDNLYNADTDINLADKLIITPPYAATRLITMANAGALQDRDPHRYDFLKRAGFRFHQSPDLFANIFERFGGHVLDHGQLSVIENRQVKVISDALPVSYTPNGLLMSNNTELPADMIVLATGFRNNLRASVTEIVGPEIGNHLDDFWGLDAEGEIRGLARPIGHPGLWYFGGGTAQARFVSRFLALQIKADLRGAPFVPFTATPDIGG